MRDPGLTKPRVKFSTSCRSDFERPLRPAEYSLAAVCQHTLTTWLQPVEGQRLASGSHDKSASHLGGHCTQYIVLPDSVNTICCVSDASSGRSRSAQFFPRIVQKSRRVKSGIPARIRLTNTTTQGSKCGPDTTRAEHSHQTPGKRPDSPLTQPLKAPHFTQPARPRSRLRPAQTEQSWQPSIAGSASPRHNR